MLRLGVEVKRITRGPLASYLTPFDGAARPIVIHCCYHKVGTVWFLRVLREVAAHFGMRFETGDDHSKIRRVEMKGDADVFLDYGSHVSLGELGDYVGSHMIRDPRDMVVSGYHYHLWTSETWARLPRAEYRGMSYQEYLNSLPKDEGLLEEIRRMSFWIRHMATWDYDDSRMYEIRYEEIMRDEKRIFREMFRHYGFSPSAVETSCRIAEKYTFKRMARGERDGESHLRSGRTGEWSEHFGDEHRALFKELYPGVVSRLGYEADERW